MAYQDPKDVFDQDPVEADNLSDEMVPDDQFDDDRDNDDDDRDDNRDNRDDRDDSDQQNRKNKKEEQPEEGNKPANQPEGEPKIGESVPEASAPEAGAAEAGASEAAVGEAAAGEMAAETAGAELAAETAAAEVAAAEGAAVAGAEAGAAAAGGAGGAAAVGGEAAGAALAPEAGVVLVIVAVIVVIVLFIIGLIFILIAGALPSGNNTDSSECEVGDGKTVICLDPGHTASQVARGAAGVEYQMTVDLANKIKPILEEKGYKVVSTRSDYNKMTLPNGKPLEETRCDDNEKIGNRSSYCSAMGASYMLSIHFDANDTGLPKGPWVIVPPAPKDTCSPNTTQNYYAKNKDYGTKILNGVLAALNNTPFSQSRGVTTEGQGAAGNGIGCGAIPGCAQLYATIQALRETPKLNKGLIEVMPATTAFRNWFATDSHKETIAEGIANGIADAIPKGQGSGNCLNGGVADLLDKAAEYVKCEKNLSSGGYENTGCALFKKNAASIGKGETDCWGFVATSLKYSVDTSITAGNVGLAEYCSGDRLVSRNGDLYEKVNETITSTKQLQPGDLLFDSSGCNDGTGHAILYTGKDFSPCGGDYNAASASLYGHGPQCSYWYGNMSRAYRLKK